MVQKAGLDDFVLGVAVKMGVVGGAKAADDINNATKRIDRSLGKLRNSVNNHKNDLAELNRRYKEGAITKSEYAALFSKLKAREDRRIARLEKEKRAVAGLDKQESILERNRRNRARMAGMAASGVSGLGMGGRAAGAARFLGGAVGLGAPATALGLGFGGLSLIKESVTAFADLEAKVASLKSLFGESLSQQLTNQFRNLAKTTILTNNQLIENAKTWASYGLTTDKLTDRLKRLGTVAGGNSEKFRSLTIAFAQVNAQGKLMGQEKNQLINAGFSLQAVADAAGISMENFADAMKNGEITAEHLNEALIKVTSEGGLFAGYLEKQAKTINGKMTILGSTFEEFLQTLGEAEQGPAGIFLDKMILAAESLKTSAEFFVGKNIFPFSVPAGQAIPGSNILPALGQTAQVDVGGVAKGFELLDILSFMGIKAPRLGPTSPYPMAEGVDAPSGFSALPTIDPTILQNVAEANAAIKAHFEYLRKVEEAERNALEAAIADPSTTAESFQRLIESITSKGLLDEVMEGSVTGLKYKDVGEALFGEDVGNLMETMAEDWDEDRRQARQAELEKLRKELAALESQEQMAKDRHDFETAIIKMKQEDLRKTLEREKKLAQGPEQKDAYFEGGSVAEFMFLRRETQINETAKAVKEAEEKANAQRQALQAEQAAADQRRDTKIENLTTAINTLTEKINTGD